MEVRDPTEGSDIMTTIAALLAETSSDELRKHLDDQGATSGWVGLGGHLAPAITKLFDIPIGNLALSAYRRQREVRAAMKRTESVPGSREVVRLAEHEIETTIEPEVVIQVNGVSYQPIEIALDLNMEVEALTVTVEHGRIVGWAPGAATASATLKAGEVTVASAATKPVQLASLQDGDITIDITSDLAENQSKTLKLQTQR